jgi:hypothetical protein
VVVGVEAASLRKSAVREGLEGRLGATGVPRPAVLLAETSPIQPLLTVQDRIQPGAPGGVQIVFPIDPPIYGVCTLGFNAYRGRTFGFVTNSHCSNVQGELDGARYYSGNPFTPAIGSELIDPSFVEGPDCPVGRKCRFSDTLFVKYDQTRMGALGKIARPAGSADSGSLNVKPTNARFVIKGRAGSPLVGDAIQKVGRTTGWTFGTVVATCVDINQGDTKVSLFCQSVVQGGGDHGDSGSPVFYLAAGNQVKLAGILWGGGHDSTGATIYVFSPLENVEADLGPLKVN